MKGTTVLIRYSKNSSESYTCPPAIYKTTATAIEMHYDNKTKIIPYHAVESIEIGGIDE